MSRQFSRSRCGVNRLRWGGIETRDASSHDMRLRVATLRGLMLHAAQVAEPMPLEPQPVAARLDPVNAMRADATLLDLEQIG